MPRWVTFGLGLCRRFLAMSGKSYSRKRGENLKRRSKQELYLPFRAAFATASTLCHRGRGSYCPAWWATPSVGLPTPWPPVRHYPNRGRGREHEIGRIMVMKKILQNENSFICHHVTALSSFAILPENIMLHCLVWNPFTQGGICS